jgi:hypothetical protein
LKPFRRPNYCKSKLPIKIITIVILDIAYEEKRCYTFHLATSRWGNKKSMLAFIEEENQEEFEERS